MAKRWQDRLIVVAILAFWFALPWVLEAMLGFLFGLRTRGGWGWLDHLLPLLLIVGSYRASALWPRPTGHLLYGCLGATVFIIFGIQYGSGAFYGPLLPQGTESVGPVAINAAAYAVLIGLLCRGAALLGAGRSDEDDSS